MNKGFKLGGLGGGSTICCCSGSGTPSQPCGPCAIPEANITISWVNPLTGNGSTTMIYTASPQAWEALCLDGAITATMKCIGGAIQLLITYYGATCPASPIASCSNTGSRPNKITLASSSCLPSFSLVFTVNGTDCPQVYSLGYTSFTITYP